MKTMKFNGYDFIGYSYVNNSFIVLYMGNKFLYNLVELCLFVGNTTDIYFREA